jgi:hypothetical protein
MIPPPSIGSKSTWVIAGIGRFVRISINGSRSIAGLVYLPTGCSFTRLTSCVGLTKRIAIKSHTSVTTM